MGKKKKKALKANTVFLRMFFPMVLAAFALITTFFCIIIFGGFAGIDSNLINALIIASVASVIVSAVLAVIISLTISRPIRRTLRCLRDGDPMHPVSLGRTDIYEIDALLEEMENLNRSLVDSASKLSQIIALAGIPIGAFEWRKDSSRVFFTDRFFKLFNVEAHSDSSGCMEKAHFDYLLKYIQKYLYTPASNGGASVYRVATESSVRWVRVTIVETDVKLLGAAVDITQETIEKRKIEYERNHDLLTQLYNRRAFHAIMQRKFEHPAELGTAALIMLDLDNLKFVNDNYGHDCGDLYISGAAAVLKKFSGKNALIARMSGDEFYMFLSGYTDKASIRAVIATLRREIADAGITLPDGKPFRVRLSAGVAWYPNDTTDYRRLINYADFAMYKVKNTVKGEFEEFDRAAYDRESYLIHGKEDINKLIEEELVEYYFHPIVSVKTGDIFAYEALMRSRMPSLGSPMEILAVARSQSKLYKIENLTWFKSLQAFSSHASSIGPGVQLFINSIPNQILSDDRIAALEEQYSPYLSRLVVELTEEEKPDQEFTVRKQDFIRRWGAKIALDDFGKGNNGDVALLETSPNFIKIDMAIVRNIDKDAGRRQILKNLVAYAKERGISIIAEGVESSGEMETLIKSGVDYLQGFYLSRPAPVPPYVPPMVRREIMDMYKKMKNEK